MQLSFRLTRTCLQVWERLTEKAPYYEQQRFLGLIPWDKPRSRADMPGEQGQFLRFAGSVAWRIGEPWQITLCFFRGGCDPATLSSTRDLCRSRDLPHAATHRALVVAPPSVDSLFGFLTSTCLSRRRAVEAIRGPGSLPEALALCEGVAKKASGLRGWDYRQWYVPYMDVISTYILFHLEHPVLFVRALALDRAKVAEALRQQAQSHAVGIQEEE